MPVDDPRLCGCAGALRSARWQLWALLIIHALVLGWHGQRQSPTFNESGHLPAGIAHWQFRMFHLYRVNPPLPRMIAAAAVLPLGPATDWSNYQLGPFSRETIPMGIRFAKANGARTLRLFTVGRWACIPFALLGALTCYWWARDIWGPSAGILAMALWVFNPMIIGYGALIMPDVPGAATGVFSAYVFSQWLRHWTWPWALRSGLALGMALLCKTTLLVLVPFYAGATVVTILTKKPKSHWLGLPQWMVMMGIAVYVVNLGYGFVGSWKSLGDYKFQSSFLTGAPSPDASRNDNRFARHWAAAIPVPLPEDYVLGMDCQKADFEVGERSYLAGVWEPHGWWYYHLLGLTIKTPVGTLLIVLLTCIGLVLRLLPSARQCDGAILLLPAIMIVALVSSQTGFSNHVRYGVPALPFVFVWCGQLAQARGTSLLGIGRLIGVCATVCASVCVWPHSSAFFNAFVGGAANGHHWLLDSNSAWGQDLLFLREWSRAHPQARPLYLAHYGLVDPEVVGIDFIVAPPGPKTTLAPESCSAIPAAVGCSELGPKPGWHVIDVNFLHGTHLPVAAGNWSWWNIDSDGLSYEYFLRFTPVRRIGYSYFVYYVDVDTCATVRAELGLLPLRGH